MLNRISENDHIIRFAPHFFNKTIEDNFLKIGVRKASTFKGFCSYHDNSLFKSIDKISDTFLSKENLIKLSFRSFAYEVRAKERVAYFLETVLSKLKSEELELQLLGIQNNLTVTCPYYMKIFSDWFQRNWWEGISAFVYEVPFIPISTSTTTEPSSLSVINQVEAEINLEQPLETVFINLVPQDDSSLVIFSFLKDKETLVKQFIDNYNSLESVIMNNCEEFLLRPSFYDSFDEPTKKKMILALAPWSSWEKVELTGLLNVKLENPKLV